MSKTAPPLLSTTVEQSAIALVWMMIQHLMNVTGSYSQLYHWYLTSSYHFFLLWSNCRFIKNETIITSFCGGTCPKAVANLYSKCGLSTLARAIENGDCVYNNSIIATTDLHPLIYRLWTRREGSLLWNYCTHIPVWYACWQGHSCLWWNRLQWWWLWCCHWWSKWAKTLNLVQWNLHVCSSTPHSCNSLDLSALLKL